MLWYQTGFFGAPPSDATTAYSPSCSTRMSGVLRSLPLLAPTVVSRMMGLPFISAASAPPDSAYLSACSRDQSQGDGSYSPVSGMSTTLGPIRHRRLPPMRAPPRRLALRRTLPAEGDCGGKLVGPGEFGD